VRREGRARGPSQGAPEPAGGPPPPFWPVTWVLQERERPVTAFRTVLRWRRRRTSWARRAARPLRPPESTPLPFAGVGGVPVAFDRRRAAGMSRGTQLAHSAGASPIPSGSLPTCATSAVVWRRQVRRWGPTRGAQLVRTLLDAQRGVRALALWVAAAATTLRAKEETAARAAGKELPVTTPASSLRRAAYHGFAHGWGPADKANRPLPCCVLSAVRVAFPDNPADQRGAIDRAGTVRPRRQRHGPFARANVCLECDRTGWVSACCGRSTASAGGSGCAWLLKLAEKAAHGRRAGRRRTRIRRHGELGPAGKACGDMHSTTVP
jgi:hypothetical protein